MLISLFKSTSNGYKIELTFKVDERCQIRPWVEKSAPKGDLRRSVIASYFIQ